MVVFMCSIIGFLLGCILSILVIDRVNENDYSRGYSDAVKDGLKEWLYTYPAGKERLLESLLQEKKELAKMKENSHG